MQAAVVGPHPDHPLLRRARRDREDGGEVLGGADVEGEAAALLLLLPLGVVGRQVRADRRPAGAAVGRLVDVLAADVDRGRLERVLRQGGVPVEAERLGPCAGCGGWISRLSRVRRFQRTSEPPCDSE